MMLNKYPEKITHKDKTSKKVKINFMLIIFLSNKASGKESPASAIIKAIAVPSGIPLATSTCTTGITPEALEYKGTARIIERGTAQKLSVLKDFYHFTHSQSFR